MIAFGPVPSRRLGNSLGINHIPPKNCTYACGYCQVGKTSSLNSTRREFYPVKSVVQSVEEKLSECESQNQTVDYLTLVPDGEPTLDIHLGEIIDELKRFEIPLAVISNASLINQPDVKHDLLLADWVSLKVDSVDEKTWKRINRPYGKLNLSEILRGIMEFREQYSGKLVTETMLVKDINDQNNIIDETINYLTGINAFVSYFSIPIRPPCDPAFKPPDPVFIQNFLRSIPDKLPAFDILFEAEPDEFVSTGDLTNDILSITAVHPLREDALKQMIVNARGSWGIVEDLVNTARLLRVPYQSGYFYIRNHSKL